MTVSLVVTLATMFIVTLCIIVTVWRKQRRITCMTGMMVAMAAGMLTGLLGGVILGVLLNGNLFLSTMISMGFGLVVGFIIGLPISVMSVLDGMLSGLMGGMMGAMLGEMVAPYYWDSMIKVMFVLFIALMTTLLYFLQDETIRKGEKHTISFIRNPFFLIIFFFVFFYLYTKLGPSVIQLENHSPHHSFKLGFLL